ncbi:MAG TPA: hypothetical protein VFU46_02910, partial [Gemmatimonadales bacterium]|nr:hypothetical protein [Gemmatimonadales bacterium]
MNREPWTRRVVARPVTGALVVALATGAAGCRERPRVPLGEVETAAPSPRPLDAAVERLLWERRPPAGVP